VGDHGWACRRSPGGCGDAQRAGGLLLGAVSTFSVGLLYNIWSVGNARARRLVWNLLEYGRTLSERHVSTYGNMGPYGRSLHTPQKALDFPVWTTCQKRVEYI
jgi:hypothetical protein